MIPSLVVEELRSSLVEYLASTFALADDDVRDALSEFLQDTGDGIFRGPYLRVRTPFRSVDEGWEWPLAWQRDGFVPHAHQAAAFDRLSTLDGREPKPTLVTTGTGSGKTECFLYPVLDHCARMREAGQRGIKALVLYPMNALASDQAARIAELVHTEAALHGIRAGLYVGGDGRHAEMGADHLIDTREALRANPPDILLTNYKMLDFLLLRRADRDLWASNTPETLRHVVLDEFHTYDGAQGTDVAMLLRRLGRTLGMDQPGRPLGDAVPVATSATLGSTPAATETLRGFAKKVFGRDFEVDSVIGETRQTVDEACGDVDYQLPIPDVDEVNALADRGELVAAFCASPGRPLPSSDVELGDRLREHTLTRAVLAAVAERPRTWRAAVDEIITRAPTWGATHMRHPEAVEKALARFLWLLSTARRDAGGRLAPLFAVDVQLWVREVSRLVRSVQTGRARFQWLDSGSEDVEHLPTAELPAVYCRHCGLSGWAARQRDNAADHLAGEPGGTYQAAVARSPVVRYLLRTSPSDPAARHLDPLALELHATPRPASGEPDDLDRHPGTVAVLATPDEAAAKAQTCPACDERDAVRFLGLRTASLASVSINTLFASPHVAMDEQKLLVFTDAVQDAAHRAAFFSGRTHRINLRSRMARIVRDAPDGRISVADLGDALVLDAVTARDRHALVPPDLLRHPAVRTVWTQEPSEHGRRVLAQRIGFEVDLEFGLRSRVGRTLELSRVAVASVELALPDATLELVVEDLTHRLGDEVPALDRIDVHVAGLLERLRQRGGLHHPLLEPYLRDRGRLWHVWGGRPDGLPPFTPGQSRPLFFTTATDPRDLDSTTAAGTTPTWMVDWTRRCLGVDGALAARVQTRVLEALAAADDAVHAVGTGECIFALDRGHVVVHDVEDIDHHPTPASVRCADCGYQHPTPPSLVDRWVGAPCLRYRCGGTFAVEQPRPTSYYRTLYRDGRTRRVVTAEHSGVLDRREREDLEASFRDGTQPGDPNVVAATPTLEMGIDIGDLSAVMLANVPPSPASYVQRVGRAGRASGNALVTTFVGTDTHGLYYLASPEAMLAGEVRPPDCYLDAIDTLVRQYLAYLMDRIADQTLTGPAVDRRTGDVMRDPFGEDGLFARLVAASTLERGHVERFVALFGGLLAEDTEAQLREYAASGIEAMLKRVAGRWDDEVLELGRRLDRLRSAIDDLEDRSHRTPEQDDELADLRGQRQATSQARRRLRDTNALSGLERLGVLPNYTLLDDTITLEATTWWREDDRSYASEMVTYQRPARVALAELAPGNSFYARGHRHRIDALDIGHAAEPRYEPWRLCPDCGYGSPEAPGTVPPAMCPRCGAPEIADTGALHTMLRLGRVFASSSEEDARFLDEHDERQREQYDLVTTVDVDPADVRGAWRLAGPTFGAEACQRATIRTINLGFRRREGDAVSIAGLAHHATRFTVCPHCGAVAEARDDRRGQGPGRRHQGWCKVRRGAVRDDPDQVVLHHELTTEAVRLLLPVSMFEVDDQLVSFTGALLLGLREVIGGELAHLAVLPASAPNRGGQGRRRFLVLHDVVPGGTGYLGRLGAPEQLRDVLEAGRAVLRACPCQAEARRACHRCLLGVVGRRDYEHAGRNLALSLLDDLLGSWEPEPVDTVAGLDLGRVEESELERRFKAALVAWAARDDNDASLSVVPSGETGRDAFDLRFGSGEQTLRYRITEQVPFDTEPHTVPDFVVRRVDARGHDVAVYLDGFQWHASAEHDRLALDARQRAGIRADSKRPLVWSLTWDDVTDFHRAADAPTGRAAPRRQLLAGRARQVARRVQHQHDGHLDVDVADRNPVQALLDHLADPDPEAWERLALNVLAGAVAGGNGPERVAANGLRAALAGQPPSPSDGTDDQDRVSVFRTTTSNGAPLVAALRGHAQDERWRVMLALDDTARRDETFRVRWHDVLQWANLLQFIVSDGRQVAVGTTSMLEELLDELAGADGVPTSSEAITVRASDAATVAATAPAVVSGPDDANLDETVIEELELVEDDGVRFLVEQVLRRGAPAFVAGHELSGEPVEAAWAGARVGVLAEGHEFELAGWDLRPIAGWPIDELLAAARREGA